MSARRAGTCSATSRTTTSGARTSRWTRMVPSIGLRNRPPVEQSSQSHTSAVCITTTNVARLDRLSASVTCLTVFARSRPSCAHGGRYRTQKGVPGRSGSRLRVGDHDNTRAACPTVPMEFLVGTRHNGLNLHVVAPSVPKKCAEGRRGTSGRSISVVLCRERVSDAIMGAASPPFGQCERYDTRRADSNPLDEGIGQHLPIMGPSSRIWFHARRGGRDETPFGAAWLWHAPCSADVAQPTHRRLRRRPRSLSRHRW